MANLKGWEWQNLIGRWGQVENDSFIPKMFKGMGEREVTPWDWEVRRDFMDRELRGTLGIRFKGGRPIASRPSNEVPFRWDVPARPWEEVGEEPLWAS